MDDFISNLYLDFILVNHSPNIQKRANSLIELAESNKFWNPNHNYYEASLFERGIVTTISKETPEYPWHTDSISRNEYGIPVCRNNRKWTQIIYFQDGSPIELGNWNVKGNIIKDGPKSTIYEPSELIARIYPKPGKTITFPSFIVHRVPKTNKFPRWAAVSFYDRYNPYYKLDKELYDKAFHAYFSRSAEI